LHSRDLYLKALEELGVPVVDRTVEVGVTPAEARAARARIQEALPFQDRPLIIVHPGAGAPNKCWPTSGFAAVCDAVQEAGLARVLLIGGPAEAKAIAEIRAAMATDAATLPGGLDARGLAAVLNCADLLFCNDSGPMHLAAAVGTRTVALYGSTSVVNWGPLGEGHTVLQPSLPCRDCAAPDRCKRPNPYLTHCVLRLTVPGVRQAVLSALEGSVRAASREAISQPRAPRHQ
jgi:ADP-heptose:LPS heptosyltransferase